MTEAAILAEAKRLKADGRGYRSIAAELGATRHQVRHWLNGAKLPAPITADAISRFDTACRALAEAKSLDEVMEGTPAPPVEHRTVPW